MTITQENKQRSSKWFLDWPGTQALKVELNLAHYQTDQDTSLETLQCPTGKGQITLSKLEKLKWNEKPQQKIESSESAPSDQTQPLSIEKIPIVNGSHILPSPPLLEELDIKQARIESIERGSIGKVNAIVLHQTNSSTASSTLDYWRNHNPMKIGAHFLIDTDGSIYQVAGLDKKVQHVGRIQPRCKNENFCDKKEKEILSTLKGPRQIHQHELTKPYPNRYPYNGDSIGIEVVGLFDKEKNTYGPPTEAQKRSLDLLVNALREKYKLGPRDVYLHSRIARKHETEAIYLGY